MFSNNEILENMEYKLILNDSYEKAIFEQFELLLEKNIKSSRTVKYYAEQLAVSPKKLNLIIKTFSGKTAKEYIEDKIIFYSKKLLLDSSMTVKQVSYLMGFTEPTNFNKFFKKFALITPLEYRKKELYNHFNHNLSHINH